MLIMCLVNGGRTNPSIFMIDKKARFIEYHMERNNIKFISNFCVPFASDGDTGLRALSFTKIPSLNISGEPEKLLKEHDKSSLFINLPIFAK